VIASLSELAHESQINQSDNNTNNDNKIMVTLSHIKQKYLDPLEILDRKFDMYRKFVEHVIDIDKLPDLLISSKHDEGLSELQSQSDELELEAKKIYKEAADTWASFADVKLEQSSQHSFYLRTTKGDDERQLRQNYPKVQILSILKVRMLYRILVIIELIDGEFSL
jgi:hypothetical protein